MTPTNAPIKIAIIETGAPAPTLEHHGRLGDWFIRLLEGPLSPVSFSIYRAYADELPDRVDAYDGYVVTGSPASVNAPDPWIGVLATFLTGAAKTLPVVGVCFGHQLLHKALGGRVDKMEGGWGVGVHSYDTLQPIDGLPTSGESLSFLACHSEHVTQPAAGTEILAASDFCPIAMSRIGPTILTVQAHPEMTKALGRDLYELRREQIGADKVATAVASFAKATDSDVFARIVARHFGR